MVFAGGWQIVACRDGVTFAAERAVYSGELLSVRFR